MNQTYTRRGFTLIELLVVVLIVGILTAVGVPQYQKAVKKSRVSTMLPILSSIIAAQEVYYLANGTYTSDGRLLDIETGCTEVSNTEGKWWKCGNYFLVNIGENGTVGASYCPNNNSSYEVCKPVREFQIGFGATHSTSGTVPPNTHRCWTPSGSSKTNIEMCKILGQPIDNSLYELY